MVQRSGEAGVDARTGNHRPDLDDLISGPQVPYLVWVSVATVLQLSITAMNV